MRRGLVSFAILIATVAGCGPPDASFVFNERTESLHPTAQDGDGKELNGLKDAVAEHFGTPNQLIAWQKLPVNYRGGVLGEIVESIEPTVFSVRFVGSQEISGVLEVRWMSGERAGQTAVVKAADFDLGRLTLADGTKLNPEPEEGDHFVLCSNEGPDTATAFAHPTRGGRALYMMHCAHCHGASGNGNGPTAKYLNPLPRDYRKGLFKFTTTKETNKVNRDDLTRIIKHGIPGTYMPSFMLLEDEEVARIVEYVRWLAMRGEVEYLLGADFVTDYSVEAIKNRTTGKNAEKKSEVLQSLKEDLAGLPELIQTAGSDMAEAWSDAERTDALIRPSIPRVEDTPASRRIGRAVFISAEAKCTNCHGPQGLGNGRQTLEFETNEETKKKWAEAGLHDKWGHIVKPRDLTQGIYRGGRRPIDIFCRVRAGIKGSGMPAFGESVISDENLWHLVNYVMSIPFERTTPAPKSAITAKKAEPAG